MIWLARSFGTGRGRQWGPALGDHLWGTASIFAWQYRNESEYLSLVRAAWCRMLKEAGLLNLGREKSYTDKRNISKYKKAATWKRDYMSSMWAKGKDFQHSEMSRDSWATSRGDTLSIFTGVWVVIRYCLSYFQDDLNLNDSGCVFSGQTILPLSPTVPSFAKWKK